MAYRSSSRGSGRLVTRLDTPPFSNRHHPLSAIARRHIAAVLWLVVSMLFSWYVANFGSYNETYGSLGLSSAS
jgi:hypothetical protein